MNQEKQQNNNLILNLKDKKSTSKADGCLTLIFAATEEGGISYKQNIPWFIKDDLRHFQITTTKLSTILITPMECDNNLIPRNAVIMGFKTFLTLKNGPLPKRKNIVLTKDLKHEKLNNPLYKDVQFASCLEDGVKFAEEDPTVEKIFIIGGSSVYNEAFHKYKCNIISTIVANNTKKIECDNFIDKIMVSELTEKDGYKLTIKDEKNYSESTNGDYIKKICYYNVI
jgi:dihydrofolate reductase